VPFYTVKSVTTIVMNEKDLNKSCVFTASSRQYFMSLLGAVERCGARKRPAGQDAVPANYVTRKYWRSFHGMAGEAKIE